MCAKTMVAKVDVPVRTTQKGQYVFENDGCEGWQNLSNHCVDIPSKTMVAKVDIHVIQLKKDYMCEKTMVAKVDMLIESFDRICTFKNDGCEGWHTCYTTQKGLYVWKNDGCEGWHDH